MKSFLICLVSFFSFLSADDATFHFRGVHFLASYSECDQTALRDVEALQKAMLDSIEKCGAHILNSSEYVFHPDGLTMVILLSESHASIHTYPEHGACFVDLFTCGNKCSWEKFDAVLREYLKPKDVDHRVMIRDRGFEECSSKTALMPADNSSTNS